MHERARPVTRLCVKGTRDTRGCPWLKRNLIVMHRKRPHSFWFLWKPCACMRVRRGMHRSKQDPISRDATRELTFQPPATETSNTCCSIDFSSHLPPHRCFCTDWVARPRSRVSALPHLHWPHQQVVLIPSPKSGSNMPTPFLLYCHHSQSHPFHLLPPSGISWLPSHTPSPTPFLYPGMRVLFSFRR